MKGVRKVALDSAWRVAVQSSLLTSVGLRPVIVALPKPQLLAWKKAQHLPHRVVRIWWVNRAKAPSTGSGHALSAPQLDTQTNGGPVVHLPVYKPGNILEIYK